jgi:hypothetical protein
MGLALGPILHTDVVDCYCGGWNGIGTTGGIAAVYDVNIIRCEFVAPGAWVAGRAWNVRVETPKRSDIGRWCLYFDGCNVIVNGVLTSNSAANNRGLIKLSGRTGYGDRAIINGVLCDNEGSSVPDFEGGLVAERTQSGAYLEVNDFAAGAIPAGAAVIDLIDRWPAPPTTNAGVCKLTNISGGGNNTGGGNIAVRTNGPGWEGTLTNCDWAQSPRWRAHSGADGRSNVVAELRLDTLPRSGLWQANAATVTLRHPTPLGARTFLCVQSGTAQWDAATPYVPGQRANYQGNDYTSANASPTAGSTPGGGNPDWTLIGAGPVALWAATEFLGEPQAA